MVPGSIPSGFTWIFSDIFPSDCTMALGSTQPQVKMSTRNIPGGKGGQCVRLTTLPPSRAECHEVWEPKPPGTLWATPGLLQDCFTFTITYPSWRHYDTQSSRVLQQGASCLWKYCWKPHCAAITDCFDKQFHCCSALLHWPALHRLNSIHHCTWWWSVWERHVAGTLVFKFQEASDVSGAPSKSHKK